MALGEERREAGKAAFEAVLEVASENDGATVVHGWIRNDGRWLAHAWCEFGDVEVVDLTQDRSRLDRAEYYAAFGIGEERLIRYTRLEYFTLVGDRGDFGPFEDALFPVRETAEEPPVRA